MYKLDPNIINLTPEFDFRKNGADFLEFITQLNNIPDYEIDLSAFALELAMSDFPYDYFATRNRELGPYMDIYMLWLSQLKYTDVSSEESNSVSNINPSPFCKYHSEEFQNEYQNVLAFTQVHEDFTFDEYFITSKFISKFDIDAHQKKLLVKSNRITKEISVLCDSEVQIHLDSIQLVFEPNPKHDVKNNPVQSHLPIEVKNRCQEILEMSIVDEKNPRNSTRYGYDSITQTYVKFREHNPYRFHGYPVEPTERELPSTIRKKFNC